MKYYKSFAKDYTGWQKGYRVNSGGDSQYCTIVQNNGNVGIRADTNVETWLYGTIDLTDINSLSFYHTYSGNSDVTAYAKILINDTEVWSERCGTAVTAFTTIDTTVYTGNCTIKIYSSKNSGNGGGTWHNIYYIASEEYLEDNLNFDNNPIYSSGTDYVNITANFEQKYVITLSYDSTFGEATAIYSGDDITLTANLKTGAVFGGWYYNGSLLSNSNPYTFTPAQDMAITVPLSYQYTYSLAYDSTLGSATAVRDTTNLNSISLSATLNSNTQFKGWYVNSSQISTNLNDTYTLLGNSAIEARFDEVFDITDDVSGNGDISYTRGTDLNDVTFTTIPAANYHFVKYVVNGVDYTTTPLILHLTEDISITAYIEEDDKFHITASTNFEYGSIYISDNDVYAGTAVVLAARPFPDYTFVRWEDGSTSNPRSIVVTENRTIIAIYQRLSDTNGIYQYRCFVKDQNHLTDPPKAFMVANTIDVRTDLLTKATSSFEVMNMDTSVNEGDIIVVYDPKGTVIYNGVIDSFEIKSKDEDEITIHQVNCSQMQSFYKGNWIYEKGDTPLDTYDGSWYFEKFERVSETYPVPSDFEGHTPNKTSTYNDNSLNGKLNIGDFYSAKCTTHIWADDPFYANVIFYTDGLGSVTLNDSVLATMDGSTPTLVSLPLAKGENELIVCYNEIEGDDGWNMYLDYRSFAQYDATKTYNVGDYASNGEALYKCKVAITTPEAWNSSHWSGVTAKIKIGELGDKILGLNSTYDLTSNCLEKNIYNIINDYSMGKLAGSNYVDPYVAQRLSGIIPDYDECTIGVSLLTQDVGTIYEMEDFIYFLYQKYGIIFDFEINFVGNNYVKIRVPNYESISIGNNIYAIKNMLPITETEELNRLVIFGSDGTYRTTQVATKTGIVEEPDISAPRFNIVNTEIVYSDDPVADLVAGNLSQEMYNHKIEFDLILKNNIYDFDEFKLGGPLEIYYTAHDTEEYYNSVLTGYELSKESNSNISEVHFICGIVRKKLTQLLTLGKV